MRIAVVTDQYAPQLGGVADVAYLLQRSLVARGHTVRIYAPQLAGTFQDPHVERVPTLSFAGGQGTIVSPFGMTKRLLEFKPDVVHLHSVGLLVIAARRAASRLQIPTVVTYHGSLADYLYTLHLDIAPVRSLVTGFSNWYFNTCSIVTAPSHGALATLRREGVTKPSLTYIPNPIDLSRFRAHDTREAKAALGIRKHAIMIFGRISQEKNIEDAVAAFAKIAEQVDAQLIFIGDGPHHSEIEKCVAERGLDGHTKFLGRLSDDTLVQAMSACEIMLTTSLTEVQPLTVLQALASSIPVVGTRAGGVPECIRDSETGYLVEPHDIDTYAERCVRLLKDEVLRAKLGAAGKAGVAAFAPENIARQFEDLFASLKH